MNQPENNQRSIRQVSSSADLAFAIVVLAAYFTTFSTFQSANLIQIILLAVLGVVYILVGTYGFNYCLRSKNTSLRYLYFLIQIPLGSTIVYLTGGVGFNAMVLFPLSGHAVILLSSRHSYYTNITIIFIYGFVIRLYSESFTAVWSGLPMFIAGMIFIVIFTQMAVDEEKARKEVERLVDELEDLTITRERNRLAREIHDGLGHYLTAILMQIQAARAVMLRSPEKAEFSMEKAQALAQDALTEVRQSVGTLRSTNEQIQPLPELIEKLIHDGAESGIPVHLTVLGTPRVLAPASHLTIYRAAQEGINNARKHSRASEIWVDLDFREISTTGICIRDNGMGAEDFNGGFGLIGLEERVRLLNGYFDISSNKNEGVQLEVRVPG
jgi:signal transduction histidine kinase